MLRDGKHQGIDMKLTGAARKSAILRISTELGKALIIAGENTEGECSDWCVQKSIEMAENLINSIYKEDEQ